MVASSQHTVAEVTAAALRFELHEAGKRLAQARADESAELDRIAALLRVGTDAGLPVDELAGRAGVERQALRPAGTPGRGFTAGHGNVDLRLACALGLGEAKSEEAVMGLLARGPISAEEVLAALRRLVEAGDAHPGCAAISGAGAGAASSYRLTVQGAARLPDRLRQATMPPAREWIVHVASTPAEAGTIVGAGELVLGEQEVSVVPAGARGDLRVPEVAWRVEASDPEAAIDAAIGRMSRLRGDVAGLDADEPVVVVGLVNRSDMPAASVACRKVAARGPLPR